MNEAQITKLIRNQKAGMSLAQPFYQDGAIFQLEFDTIIRRQWLLADHESRIPAQGDYFLVKVAQDTIITDKNACSDPRNVNPVVDVAGQQAADDHHDAYNGCSQYGHVGIRFNYPDDGRRT